MKAKNLIILILLVLAGGLSSDVFAQENLKAFVVKCESNESVKMTVVRQRNPNTKKVTQVITSISIKSNPTLVNELLAAFKKDEENTTQSIETKKNGKIVPEYYSFGNTSYSLSIKDDGSSASLSVIEK
ncbi:MAG: DUF5024 domain-containing protein [Dysgonomonas sp.]|nr:DUF5024 domain-containing protein [Dysgonomonas sp.]